MSQSSLSTLSFHSIPNIVQDLAADAFRNPRFAAGEAGAETGHVKDMADGRGCKDEVSKCVSSQILNDVRYIAPSPPILTPKESPISKLEWVIAAVETLVFTLVVLPCWLILGAALIGPLAALKAIHPYAPLLDKQTIDHAFSCIQEVFSLLSMIGKITASGILPQESLLGKGKPILLIHGYLSNPTGWTTYLKTLPEEGLGPVFTMNLGHPFLSIQDYAEMVKKKAEEIEQKTQRKDLALIGHSMGGVISALYASKLAPRGSVTHVFTIGSPLKGSPLARYLAVGPNGREMQEGSPLLKEIRKAIAEKEREIQFYHIGSTADAIVPIASSLPRRHPERELAATDLNHTALLTSRKVAKWICACLKQGEVPS